MRMLAAGTDLAPTLATACAALPPGGAELRLGRPCASFVAPTLVASCGSLPLGGAGLAWGGAALATEAPTLATACAALPPEGAAAPAARQSRFRGPCWREEQARHKNSSTLVAWRTALPARSHLRGFTLIELLIVVAIMAVATAGVALSLRDSSGTALEREAQRLAVLLESARAQSRMSAIAVRWRTTATGFAFDGLPDSSLPTQWLSPDVRAAGTPVVTLGPEPIIGPQQIRLVSISKPENSLMLATDGLRPFSVRAVPAAGSSAR